MKCDECGNAISGSYFETDGKTVCKKDYEEVSNLFFGEIITIFLDFFFFFNFLHIYFDRNIRKLALNVINPLMELITPRMTNSSVLKIIR